MKTEALALAAQQDAVRREDDHGPALAMNAEYDRARLQALADQHLADNRALGALTDADDDLWPTDEDIVDALVEAFNMDRSEVIDRLTTFDAAAARADMPLPGGQYYSTTTFKDNGKPILCNADGSRSIFCDVDE